MLSRSGDGGGGDEGERAVDEDVLIIRGRLKTLLGDAIPSALGAVKDGPCEEPAGDPEDADIILGRLGTLRQVGDAAAVAGAAVDAPLGRAATLGRGRVPESEVLRLATCPRDELPRDSGLSVVAERLVLRAVCGFPTFEAACVENRVF